MWKNFKKYGTPVVAVLALISFLWLSVEWGINRVWVPEGCSLMLRYRGPLLTSAEYASKGHFAEEGQVGILANLRGPGRHFYCPIWWERTIVDHENKGRGDLNVEMHVKPGEVAIVRSALGDDLPVGEYLVDGDFGATKYKGVMRKVYGPGIYRAHPYAYQFTIVKSASINKDGQIKHSGWVEIPTGYVGVVTNLANIPSKKLTKGIQENVLPPGIYPINGLEQEVDIVEIGYRETTLKVVNATDENGVVQTDEAGEPVISDGTTGIDFPSSDGFNIFMDFTSIWGVMPEQAPSVIKRFGNVDAIENRVILPQTESIGRNTGSAYSAKELLVGTDRAGFQQKISDEFSEVLEEKDITLLYGLVRAIYIPQEVRKPTQNKYIADELKLTRIQEQKTAMEEAKLRDAEREVELERQKIDSATQVLVGDLRAEGEKRVGEIDATTRKLVATIDRKTAELEAEAEILLGDANANASKLENLAKADKLRLAVESFGTVQAYNKYIFASELSDDIKLKFLFAGEGTLWTDLKNIQPTIPLK